MRDVVEQSFLTAVLSNIVPNTTTTRKLWIGLTDQDSDKVYVWPDNTNAIYVNWRCSQPGSGGYKACATMEVGSASKGGVWDDESCSATAGGYVCKTLASGSSELSFFLYLLLFFSSQTYSPLETTKSKISSKSANLSIKTIELD